MFALGILIKDIDRPWPIRHAVILMDFLFLERKKSTFIQFSSIN